jgi:hypothetical protein
MPSTSATARAASALSVALDQPAGEHPLRLADRAAERAVELDRQVGDAAGGDVGGDVDLAAAHDAEVDHRRTGAG